MWEREPSFLEKRVGSAARRMKRAGVLLFYQIVGEHKLGDPRENATHQSQLQDFSVTKVLGKFAVQRGIQCALGLSESQLFS